MTGRLADEPFIAFQPSLARKFGVESALLLAYVAYRQPADGSPVAIPVREFIEVTTLSDSTVKRQSRALVDRGVLRKHQAPGRVAEYAVVRDHADLTGPGSRGPQGGVSVTSPDCSSLEGEENPSRQEAGDGVVVALFGPSGEVEKRAAPVAAWTPEERTRACREAWFEGYAETHPDGPDRTVTRRALGQIKTVAGDRTDNESWQRLWRAARAAGAAGRWDIAGYLDGPPRSRFPSRGNLYAHMAATALASSQTSPNALLGAMLDQDRPAIN